MKDWAARGESETQEFKTTTGQRSEAAKAVCAMLNHKGGRVVGQAVTDKTVEDVAAYLRMIEPPAFPAVERVPIGESREALMVSVERGSRRPYTFQGKAYRRLGTTNAEMPREDYNRMLLEELHATSRWENQFAEGWTVKDLDEAEIARTMEEAIRRGRAEDPGTRAPVDLLRGLMLAKGGQLLRAAVILALREALANAFCHRDYSIGGGSVGVAIYDDR